jgi:ABC-2 type transport system permease protein
MSTTATAPPTSAARGAAIASRRPGIGAVLAVESRKILALPRTRVIALILVVAPWVFILLVLHQDRLPLETLYGRYLKVSGFATPMVVLVAAAQWVLPLLASIVSGDMFSADDNHGTYKTILTRSTSRNAIFWGKTLTALLATSALILLLGASSLLAGLTTVGAQSFVDVGSGELSPGHSLWMVAGSWLSVLPPVIGFAAIALCVSILTRSSVLGVVIPVVVGLVFQMYTFLNAWDTVRHSLLNTPMNAWRGLYDNPSYSPPFWHGLIVSAVYTALSLLLSYVVFRNRDVTEG